jgi:WD40 repeat protein
MFLSLACAACGRNTVQSSAGAARAPARDPVTLVYALAWAPDGARLASGGQDQAVHLWNTTTGRQVFAYRSRFSTGGVLALAWSPDDKQIASVSAGGVVHLWNATTGQQVWLLHL